MPLAPCIYCKVVDVPRTREHVLQAAFGAPLTLPTEVCADCNGAFSSIDKDLVDHANLLARGRVDFAFGLGLQEDPCGVLLTSRLGTRGSENGLAAPPPQMFLHPDGSWHFHGRSADVLELMMTELAAPERVSERVDEHKEGTAPVALAIVRTAPAMFLVRGSNAAEVAELADKLRRKDLQVAWMTKPTTWEPPPKVAPILIDSSFPVGNIARCLAKVGLNYVCNLFGTDVTLRDEFDRIRRFARYGNESFLELVTPAMLDHEQQTMMRGYADPLRHALVVNQIEKDSIYHVLVQVMLYGTAMGTVRLGASRRALLPLGTWHVTYFDYQQKTVEHFDVPDPQLRCFANIDALVPGASSMVATARQSATRIDAS